MNKSKVDVHHSHRRCQPVILPLAMRSISIAQLQSFELFAELPAETLEELRQGLRTVFYHPGDLIFQEGGPAAGLYLVMEGRVVYGKYSGRRNRRRLLKVLGPQGTFGEEMLFAPEVCPCPGFARAVNDVTLFFLERTLFWKIADQQPLVLKRLCEWLTRQLKIFECKLVELAYEPLEQNLLRLLYIFMQRFGTPSDAGVRIDLELTRQDLADLLGVHLDTVIHELSRFRDQGLLSFEGHKIVIKDPEKLRERAEPHTTCLDEKLF